MTTREIEEKRSLNGMWHKSKGKLVVLRLACGLDSRGNGEVTRDHILVPDTKGNAMLECAQSLVEDGMLERPGRERASLCFYVTRKGMERAKMKSYTGYRNAGEETQDATAFDPQRTYVDVMSAQEILLDIREGILGVIGLKAKAKNHDDIAYYNEVDDDLTEALRHIGDMAYKLSHRPKAK